MSPHHERQAHPVIKSESPPLQSVAISSIGQSLSQYANSAPHFCFGAGEHNSLPPFSFMSQPRSSSSPWPHHTPVHSNPYSASAPASQSHLGPPSMDDSAVLSLTDEYDDGDELGDLPSASGSAVDIFPDSSGASSRMLDKSVRRRSSKGPSQLFPLI